MAKVIRSLTPAFRAVKRVAEHNQSKKPGVRCKEELNRRVVRDINGEQSKKPALRALKKSIVSQERERKPFIRAGAFSTIKNDCKRNLTPRQIARLFRRPAILAVMLTEHMSDEQVARATAYFENLLEEKELNLQAA